MALTFDRRLVLAGVLLPATSYSFFGNVAVMAMSSISDKELEPLVRVRAWNRYYKVGLWQLFVPAAASIPLWAWLAYKPETALAQKFALAGLLASISIIPFSGLYMLPINSRLVKIGESKDAAKAQQQGVPLVDRWLSLHNVRIVGYAVSWISTVALLAYA